MKHALGSVFSPNTRTQNFELLASWHDCAGSIKEARNQAHFISTHESKLTLSGTRNPYVIYCGNIKPWFLRTYCRLLHQSCLQSLASISHLGGAWESEKVRYPTTFVYKEVVWTIGNLSARETKIQFYSARVPVQFIFIRERFKIKTQFPGVDTSGTWIVAKLQISLHLWASNLSSPRISGN